MGEYQSRNAAAWDRLATRNSQFARVATDAECQQPLATLDSRGWLPKSVAGLRVLCLASGGGWQSILYASAGADVTVVDLSAAMLQLDEREAARRGLRLKTLRASMSDLSALASQSFDLVHQPVSTCYVPDIAAVYAEVSRLLCPGGLYISQHKTPTSLQITRRTRGNHYVLGIEYYGSEPLPEVEDESYRERGAVEFRHRWEQLIGDLCRAGFVIEDLCEPKRADPSAPPGHFRHRGRFVAPYVRIKARRISEPGGNPAAAPSLWIPDGM